MSDQAIAGRLSGGSRKVTDEIIETLRRDISTGSLAIGDRLPTEKQLAAQFGVSQPTMREVVRALDAMGLVEVRHGSGAYVRGDGAFLVRTGLETMLQLEEVGLLEILDLRGVLGRSSAALAAAAADMDDIDAMEVAYAALDDMARIRDLDRLIEAIANLQVCISEAAHNPLQSTLESFFIDLLLNLQIKAMRKRGLSFWRERATGFQPDRRAILDAISTRDATAAESAMSSYLEHQRETFLSDPDLRKLKLRDPRAVDVASAMRRTPRRSSSVQVASTR